MGPVTCNVSHTQSVGCVGTSPTEGRSPTIPQNDAGMRSDPPRSVPSASAIMPVASAAAPPPVDPPALRLGSHGLRVRPNTSLNVLAPAANSGQFVLPRITAPACAKALDDERIFLRDVVGINRRAERGPQPRDRRHILDAHGQSAEQTRILTPGEPRIERPRVIHGPRVQRDDGVQFLVELRDAFQRGANNVGHRDLAGANPALQLRRGQIRERCHGFCHSPVNATARQNAASPPLNFQGKQPRMSRLFCSSGAAMSPPRFSMCMQSLGNSALWVS